MTVNEAITVLRAAALARVDAKQIVSWFECGNQYSAEPRDDKYDGAWLVRANGWEFYRDTRAVREAVERASGYPFEELAELPK